MSKKYLVLGAGGTIGGAVARKLHREGNEVIGTVRWYQRDARRKALIQDGVDAKVLHDIANSQISANIIGDVISETMLDGVIYAIGHCPSEGFQAAIRFPLSQLPLDVMLREIDIHVLGVMNAFQLALPFLKNGGCFLFISSAITRIPEQQWPDFLQVHHHAAVISATDWLIRGMRADPTVKKRGIKIHRIAPAAVDTPFHEGDAPKPPRLIPLSEVVQEISAAIQSEETVDKQIF